MSNRTLVAEVYWPGNPKAKQRPRLGRNGGTYTPARTVAAENEVGTLVKLNLRERADGEFPDSASDFALEVRIHECKPNHHQVDGDNVLKLIQDALNGIVWEDDTQVTETHTFIKDRNARKPHTVITVYRLESNR